MITIQDIAFVRYQATGLDKMAAFFDDFGLHPAATWPAWLPTWARGWKTTPTSPAAAGAWAR